MVRMLLPMGAVLAACTPSPEEAATRGPGPAGSEGEGKAVPSPSERGSGNEERAALGPVPEPVSAAENPVPAGPADSPAEAQGRRTLSTAFVMVSPDGHLTVELRNGRVLVLRNVVMRRKDYCGVQVLGGPAGAKYCGGYAEVAAARPGGAPAPEEPVPAVSNPVDSPRGGARRN